MTNTLTRKAEQDVVIIQKVKDVLVPSKKRHKIIAGGRAKGASWSIVRVLLLEGMNEELFIPCIREVQKTIKYSVKKLLDDTIKMYNWQWFYRSTDTEIIGINGTKFVFFGMQEYNADNVKSLEGADRCWVAEAQSISRKTINVLRPTIRKEGSQIWWDFNPRYDTDPIYVDYVLYDDPNAEVLWLSWKDNPFFNQTLMDEKNADYARNEEEARHIWEGELRNAGDMFVCPSSLVDVAIDNHIDKLEGTIVVGADIAHQGGDEIVFYKRIGMKTVDKYINNKMDTKGILYALKGFMQDRSVILNIDNGYIGAAIADLMEDDGYIVNRINFGGTPTDREHYEDTVTEMYFQLRDNLQYIDMPKDDELRGQLIQRKYKYIRGRRGYEVMKIESKDEFSEHNHGIHKSPDRADAFVLCYYDIEEAGGTGETVEYNIF